MKLFVLCSFPFPAGSSFLDAAPHRFAAIAHLDSLTLLLGQFRLLLSAGTLTCSACSLHSVACFFFFGWFWSFGWFWWFCGCARLSVTFFSLGFLLTLDACAAGQTSGGCTTARALACSGTGSAGLGTCRPLTPGTEDNLIRAYGAVMNLPQSILLSIAMLTKKPLNDSIAVGTVEHMTVPVINEVCCGAVTQSGSAVQLTAAHLPESVLFLVAVKGTDTCDDLAARALVVQYSVPIVHVRCPRGVGESVAGSARIVPDAVLSMVVMTTLDAVEYFVCRTSKIEGCVPISRRQICVGENGF